MQTILLEVCVDSFESAVAAIQGGADRLELCAALSEGGLTPSVGLLREIKQYLATEYDPPANDRRTSNIPIYCMIRCRRGSDFIYSTQEMNAMVYDLQQLKLHGADGFVFGALASESGRVHRDHCNRVIAEAGNLPVTFHRAIDCTQENELEANLRLIAQLGFSTVLTSGLQPTAAKGMKTIGKMKEIVDGLNMETGKSLRLMPGSGISAENVVQILQGTSCDAVHGSASSVKPSDDKSGTLSMGGSNVDAVPLKVCSRAKVEELRQLIDSYKV